MQHATTKRHRNYLIFLLVTTIYFGLAFIAIEYLKMPTNGLNDIVRSLFQYFVVVFASFGLIILLSINKLVFATIFPFFILLCSILAFFRGTANIILNANLIEVSVNNDIKTSVDLISVPLILFVFFNLIVSIWLVRFRYKKIEVPHKFIYLFTSILIVLSTNYFITTSKAAVQNRIPYVVYQSFIEYYENKKEIHTTRPNNSFGATCKTDSLTVVFVLGETLRADHLGINGYKRSTTPLLNQANVISFNNIYSPYTNTERSVPYILTPADSLYPDKAYTERSFISIFNACKFKTFWIANQEPTKSFAYFPNETDSVFFTNSGNTVYNFAPYSWLDEATLPPLQEILNNKTVAKSLIVIHTIGSHWWYKTHYSKEYEKFIPVIKSRTVSSNSLEEMTNTYDNTILYTDYYLSTIIQLLKNKKAILFYLSDHGEALGENGMWLHAIEAAPIHNPACIVWMSDKYKLENPTFENILQSNRKKHFNTSFLFPSILMAAGISAPLSDTTLSILSLP